MKTRMLLIASLLALSACNRSTPTPVGTTLLVAKFGHDEGGPPDGTTGGTTARHVSKVPVAGGAAEVEVRLDTIEIPGGKYLQGVEVVVTESGGGVLTAQIPQGMMPINRGTPEQVFASMTMRVDWRQEKAMSSSLRQTSIELSADGTASAK